MRKTISIILVLMLVMAAAPTALAEGTDYADMPAGGWARDAVTSARDYGLMEGVGGGRFGVGETMSRGQFATVLVRMFGWETAAPEEPAFSDVSGNWAEAYINTAVMNGAIDPGGAFRPDEPITRAEMSVMLVRALGYGDIAEGAADYALPFTDVSADRGYIAVAYDIGMTRGVSPTSFAPEETATREQAAAMLVRVYEKHISETEWTHAFYAFSSYGQIELAKRFDAVSFGWSRLCFDETGGPRLNTTSSDGNEYFIPADYDSAVTELESAGVKLHLEVFMEASGGLSGLLAEEKWRAQAVDAIMAELTRDYPELGRNPYSGVTIDFEGLREAQKADYTAFLAELAPKLREKGLTLYVAVMPAASGAYYDGYDYLAIGDLADKVILMAHDYNARNLDGFIGTTYYKNTALTPLGSVYYSLRAAADPETGVRDKGKLALAINFASIAWEVDPEGLLMSGTPSYPAMETVYSRLASGAQIGWSETYRNPWATYDTESGQHIFLWYEDERSVGGKLDLARLFGVAGVSVWRLGLIPDHADEGLYLDAMSALQ